MLNFKKCKRCGKLITGKYDHCFMCWGMAHLDGENVDDPIYTLDKRTAFIKRKGKVMFNEDIVKKLNSHVKTMNEYRSTIERLKNESTPHVERNVIARLMKENRDLKLKIRKLQFEKIDGDNRELWREWIKEYSKKIAICLHKQHQREDKSHE